METLVFESKQPVGMTYDSQPKLRLKGSGFMTVSDDLEALELSFQPALSRGETYKVSVKADDTLSLELVSGKR